MRIAERRGWTFQRTRGDHRVFEHPRFSNNLSVPDHREMRLGTLIGCIKKMDMTVEEFLAELRR
jgi:predicted RNA binding protein YcfA (HicA-like mRNA interferase family)